MRILICLLLLLCLICNGNLFAQKVLSGRIYSTDSLPIAGASVYSAPNSKPVITDRNGNFRMTTLPGSILEVRATGFRSRMFMADSVSYLSVLLEPFSEGLEDVVVYSGFESLSKHRQTGSYAMIDSALFNRSVGPDVLSRLQGVSSGVLFDNNAANPYNISIRGRNTIMANTGPLLVVDNFAFDGDINSINPNDILNVTILKDAAAASIWGARAANGVIVITTKKGRNNQSPVFSINSNLTTASKPDLFYQPLMSSADYIEMEKTLFDQGHYDVNLMFLPFVAVTPVVDLLDKVRSGEISPPYVEEQFNRFGQLDYRKDYLRYLYRHPLNQQYAASISGGTNHSRYYISGGYDHNLDNQKGNDYKRISFTLNNTQTLFADKLQLNSAIVFTHTLNKTSPFPSSIGFGGMAMLYPYAQLADNAGKTLSIAQYRQGYVDTVGDAKLLDWNYRPLDELHLADNKSQALSARIDLGLKYSLIRGVDIELKYQYNKGNTERRNNQSIATFATRDYINQFTQVDETTGDLIYAVPYGGIMELGKSSFAAHNGRAQLTFNRQVFPEQQLSLIAGAEIKDYSITSDRQVLYGYDPTHETSIAVDNVNSYLHYVYGYPQRINSGQGRSLLSDRYFSYFASAVYSIKNKYNISASARADGSNIFGVNTNQKTVPLWSTGTSWDLSREPFWRSSFLSLFKLRASYGFNGNIDKSVTAYLTARIAGSNLFNLPKGDVINPPNPNLRWEKNRIINIGVDFSVGDNIVSGTIEYFHKKGTDLIGNALLSPSSGLTSYRGNTASTSGHGIDLTLNTHNIRGKFAWQTTLLLSYARDKVTSYLLQLADIRTYVLPTFSFNPLEGRPVSALYSFRWKGLDGTTGDPIGYASGKETTNYAAILGSTDLTDLAYSGPTLPPWNGSLMNSFSWRNLSLSFNIIAKFGYVFRRNSVNYSQLFDGQNQGHKDYASRWQQPGDEQHTIVPSLVYPADPNRDLFYNYSEALIEKGDHIRLQDIRLSYSFSPTAKNHWYKSLQVYGYAANLGIIWRKNKLGLDPDANGSLLSLPQLRIYSVGITATF